MEDFIGFQHRLIPDPQFLSTSTESIELVRKTAEKMKNDIQEYEDRANTSITNFIKKAMVLSRVYIQNSIVDDPSLDDNLSTIQNQYLSFILTALELDTQIIGGKTVKKLVSTVSTESYRDFTDLLDTTFGIEDYDIEDTIDNIKRRKDNRIEDLRDVDAKKKVKVGSGASINKDMRDLSISSGRMVEISLTNAAGGTTVVRIPVQLIPVVLPNEVANQIVTLNFPPSFRQRWLQASAGEISFFKDLLFNVDLIKKKKEALKKDTTGLLREQIRKQHNAAFKTIMKLAGMNNKQNIANSIYIFNKQDFMRFAHDSGLNWRNPTNRSKFFANTASFMCVLIDPIYAKSEYYWDGFDAVGEYSAKQLSAAAKKDSYNLKDIMAAFSQGNSPRF